MEVMDAVLLAVDCSCSVDDFTKCHYYDLVDSHVPLGLVLNKCDVVESCPAMVRRDLSESGYTSEISARDPSSAREALARFVVGIKENR